MLLGINASFKNSPELQEYLFALGYSWTIPGVQYLHAPAVSINFNSKQMMHGEGLYAPQQGGKLYGFKELRDFHWHAWLADLDVPEYEVGPLGVGEPEEAPEDPVGPVDAIDDIDTIEASANASKRGEYTHNRFCELAYDIRDKRPENYAEAFLWLVNLSKEEADRLADRMGVWQGDARLDMAFIWNRTPQGHKFWLDICYEMEE